MECPNCHYKFEFEPSKEDDDSDELPIIRGRETCTSVNHRLETMGMAHCCDLVDETLHRVKCLTCGKIGWYSPRGRLAEQKGVTVRELTAEEYSNPEKFIEQ